MGRVHRGLPLGAVGRLHHHVRVARARPALLGAVRRHQALRPHHTHGHLAHGLAVLLLDPQRALRVGEGAPRNGPFLLAAGLACVGVGVGLGLGLGLGLGVGLGSGLRPGFGFGVVAG